jgi:hypothetical protein
VYTSPDDPSSLRHFCGFCGTPLSYWSESPPEESEFISLTLGTLEEDDLRDLEDLGLVPGDVGGESEGAGTVELAGGRDLGPGVPWFEHMVSGSRLGSIQRSSGTRRGRNWSVEWEIVEWTGDETPNTSLTQDPQADVADTLAGKRKLDDAAESDAIKKNWNDPTA